MTAKNAISDLLAAPISPDWTIEGLAEQLLVNIAAQSDKQAQELVLDAMAVKDRQTQRIIRPLLACLATKSAAESGIQPNIYGGGLWFERTGPEGPVWIVGQFENQPGSVKVAFQRSTSPPQNAATANAQSGVTLGASSTAVASPPKGAPSAPEKKSTGTQTGKLGRGNKRQMAEAWVAEYMRTASVGAMAGAKAGASMRSGSPSSYSPHAVTMCFEIGKIYRDNWSHVDAERLAKNLPNAGMSVGGAVRAALAPSLRGVIGALVGIAAWWVRESIKADSNNLSSLSDLIIKHFESDR